MSDDDLFHDLRELLSQDQDEDETPEDARRRNLYIIGGAAGGILIIVVLCIVVYSRMIAPRLEAGRQTQVAEEATQIAALNPSETPTPPPPTSSPTPIAPSETPTPDVAETSTSTPLPSPSPTVPSPTPTVTETPVPTSTPDVLFDENFEGSGGAWPPADEETYQFGIRNGAFRMFVDTFFVDIWTVRGRQYPDVRLEVDLSKAGGPETGYAGLICRFQNNGNYYAFVVDGAGTYRIFRKSGGVSSDLADPVVSAGAALGEAAHRLRADCVGNTLSLYVDGEMLVQVQDEAFENGQVGLLAGTQADPGLEVFFDNLIIANP